MPKKTKKMKKRAAARFQSGLIGKTPGVTVSELSDQAKTVVPTAKNTVMRNINEHERDDFQITSYFKTDLRKSIFLILCVITLEIIFYFASMNTGLAKLFTIK